MQENSGWYKLDRRGLFGRHRRTGIFLGRPLAQRRQADKGQLVALWLQYLEAEAASLRRVKASLDKLVAEGTDISIEAMDDLLKGMPLSRMGEVDDMVNTCLFLLSDDASWITGQIIQVDGGQIMRP